MAKVIFILQRKSELTREECVKAWSGAQHVSVVKRIPGLIRWVQNCVVDASDQAVCDGVGEIWFTSDEAMDAALQSPEMAAAVEDAKRFLDMERTAMVMVAEQTAIG